MRKIKKVDIFQSNVGFGLSTDPETIVETIKKSMEKDLGLPYDGPQQIDLINHRHALELKEFINAGLFTVNEIDMTIYVRNPDTVEFLAFLPCIDEYRQYYDMTIGRWMLRDIWFTILTSDDGNPHHAKETGKLRFTGRPEQVNASSGEYYLGYGIEYIKYTEDEGANKNE